MVTAPYLFEIIDDLRSHLRGGEIVFGWLASEESDFVRFNRARVRQAMTIRQANLTLSLISGKRRDAVTLSLGGAYREDRERAGAALERMRGSLAALPEDPYLLYSTEPSRGSRVEASRLPAPDEALGVVLDAAKGTDFVGIFASGPVRRACASSLGHRHEHEVASYQLDFSLYHARDKAAKGSLAGFAWEPSAVGKVIDETAALLGHLTRPAKTIDVGAHRAYLSPSAVAELVAMLSWGGVSAKAQRTKTSSLQRLVDGEARLSEKVHLRENTAEGLAPAFDEVGFQKPAAVELVREGKHAGAMVSARSAVEYGISLPARSTRRTCSRASIPGST